MTLDILRGLAIIGILLIHSVVFGIFVPDPDLYYELLDRAPLFLIILLSPLVLVSSWFTIFVFVNGVTVSYSFVKECNKEAPNYERLFYKKIVNAFTLVLLGALYAPLFSHTAYNGGEFKYSAITGTVYLMEWAGIEYSRFYGHSIFAGIAYSSVLVSLFVYLIFKFMEEREDFYVTTIYILTALGIIFIIFSFLLESVESGYGIDERLKARNMPILAEIYRRFYSGRHSVLPEAFFGFPGAVFGIIMRFEGNQKHQWIKNYGIISGTLLLIFFGIYSFVFDVDLIGAVVLPVQPIIIQVGNLALLLLLSTWIFLWIDFHPNQKLMRDRTRFIRRFSMTSMTVYTIEALPAAVLRNFFILIGGEDIFPWKLSVDVLYVSIVFLYWHFALKLWAQHNFKGSFEWAIASIMGVFGAKTNRLDTSKVLV